MEDIMHYAEAMGYNGPKPKIADSLKVVRDLMVNSTALLTVIDHPVYPNVFAEIDPFLNVPLFIGIRSEAFGVVAIKNDKLVIVQKRSAHWHMDKSKTKIALDNYKELYALFSDRVGTMMA